MMHCNDFFVFRWLHETSCRTPLVDAPLRNKAGHKAKKTACPLPWTDRSLPFACNDLSYQLIWTDRSLPFACNDLSYQLI